MLSEQITAIADYNSSTISYRLTAFPVYFHSPF